mmetsp:Transcript_58590/g.104181  ORF Transcript_58590/g.104181 Transcript_58590/m.104181 type:complete len:299 (-) Transcript_58590:142-1038(-)
MSNTNLFKLHKEVQREKAALKTQKAELKEAASKLVKYDEFMKVVNCEYIKKSSDVDAALGEVLARIEAELKSPVKKDGASCVEDQGFCPEGTSPQLQRAYNPAQAALFGTVAFWGVKPVAMAVAAGVGVVMAAPGVPLAAAAGTSAALAMQVPWGFMAAPVASYLGKRDLHASCRCFENDCHLNQATDKCEITLSAASSNPFQSLPYPGQKCARTPSGCSLQFCISGDWSSTTEHEGILGKVGELNGEVYNCLSRDGTDNTALNGYETLPANFGNNTAAHRNELYKELGVELLESYSA